MPTRLIPNYANELLKNFSQVIISAYKSATFLMQRIGNMVTQMVFKDWSGLLRIRSCHFARKLGDRGTWLPFFVRLPKGTRLPPPVGHDLQSHHLRAAALRQASGHPDKVGDPSILSCRAPRSSDCIIRAYYGIICRSFSDGFLSLSLSLLDQFQSSRV